MVFRRHSLEELCESDIGYFYKLSKGNPREFTNITNTGANIPKLHAPNYLKFLVSHTPAIRTFSSLEHGCNCTEHIFSQAFIHSIQSGFVWLQPLDHNLQIAAIVTLSLQLIWMRSKLHTFINLFA